MCVCVRAWTFQYIDAYIRALFLFLHSMYLIFTYMSHLHPIPIYTQHRYLHLDDYERARRRMRWAKAGLVMSLALLICLVLYDLIYPTPPPPPAQGQEAAATSVVEGEEEGGEGGDSPSPSLPPQEPNPAAAGGNGGGGGQESAATAGKQHHLARERRRQQQQQLASTSPLLAAAALMSSRGRGAVGGDGEGSVATEKED